MAPRVEEVQLARREEATDSSLLRLDGSFWIAGWRINANGEGRISSGVYGVNQVRVFFGE
jgi:hypothetical protein